MADNWTDPETGYTWSYTVSDDGATIEKNKWATGDLVIPATINGYSVRSIGSSAFSYCSGLTSITIPNSVTSIGYDAFRGCSGLTSITIPNSVTTIGGYAFYECWGLTSINIPNSVTSIGGDAFRGCSGLTSVTIPNSVRSIGEWAFRGCSGLNSLKVENGNPKYDSRNNCNAIIKTETNTLISGCKNTTIPNSVTSIGGSAFYGCTNLTSITIPNSVTTIGTSAFGSCSGLTSITIPNSVTTIGTSAFGSCSGLTSLKVESGNTKYDSRDNCNAIIETATNTLICGCKETVIPNSVTSIGDDAFKGCSGLTSVTIPNRVTSIGDWAFSGCSILTSITIPNSVTSIGDDAFKGCSGLTSVTIPNRVTSIGDWAFGDCSGLTSVTIPNSVTSIGNYAFYQCSSLTSITIPNNVTSIGNYAFYQCSSLTSITIPNNVTSIGKGAFYQCSSLTSITIPNNVTFIGDGAFYGCWELTSVTIPNSVTFIGDRAFYSCNKLTSVVSKMDNPSSINSECFPNNVFKNTTLYVPQGTIDKYQATESWNKFLHIEELNSSNMCATPTISYKNGKLSYNCETEGAICQTTITDTDIASFSGNEIDLTVTYNISVYATKDGYFDSDMATATLCWVEVNPQNEGIATDVNQIASVAVLIKANGGQLTIEGADDNTAVTAYTLDGVQLGSAVSRNGVATINTNVSAGTVTIVKIGSKSVKIVMQ